MSEVIIQFLLFVLGASIGSFIHLLVRRVHNNYSIVRPSSRCDYCGHPLAWYELIPLVSFIIFKRRCLHCKHKLDWWFFLSEVITGVIFVLLYHYSFVQVGCTELSELCGIRFFHHIGFFIVLFTLFLFDLLYFELPDIITIPVIFFLVLGSLIGRPQSLGMYVLAACVAGGFFLLQYLVSRGKWIGFGDVFLGVIMGLILGWPNVLIALGLAYIVGAIIAVVLLLLKKKKRTDPLPFGVFLTTATFVTYLYGEYMVMWLSQLLV